MEVINSIFDMLTLFRIRLTLFIAYFYLIWSCEVVITTAGLNLRQSILTLLLCLKID